MFFALFAVVFFVSRLMLYPRYVCWSAAVESVKDPAYDAAR